VDLQVRIVYNGEDFIVGKMRDFYLFWEIKGDLSTFPVPTAEEDIFTLNASFDLSQFEEQLDEDDYIQLDLEVYDESDQILLAPIDDEEKVDTLKRRIVAERL